MGGANAVTPELHPRGSGTSGCQNAVIYRSPDGTTLPTRPSRNQLHLIIIIRIQLLEEYGEKRHRYYYYPLRVCGYSVWFLTSELLRAMITLERTPTGYVESRLASL